MKSKKLFFPVLLLLIIFFVFIYKIDFKRDLVWNLKNILHPQIIYQLKKGYLLYYHKVKRTILLKKISDEIFESSLDRNFLLTKYQNKMFKKNGPKAFIEFNQNNFFLITGTGILSYSNIENFKKDNIKFKIIDNNLLKLLSVKKLAKNPGLVLNMNIHKDYIYISYVNEIKENCFNTSVIRAKINFEKMIFEKVFIPDECVNKINDYGEFYLFESGGAIEFFNDKKFFLSTGTFRYRDLSQNKENIFGKILLINMDKKETEIISIGHRNVQGMFYDKKKDLLILVEHGPQGGDEINLNLNPNSKRSV